jgi:hypothetical protein
MGQSACIKTAKTLSIVPQFSREDEDEDDTDIKGQPAQSQSQSQTVHYSRGQRVSLNLSGPIEEKDQTEDNVDLASTKKLNQDQEGRSDADADGDELDFRRKKPGSGSGEIDLDSVVQNEGSKPHSSSFNSNYSLTAFLTGEEELEAQDKAVEVPDFLTAVQMTPSDAGLPLTLFTKVSISYFFIIHEGIDNNVLTKK